MSDFWTNLAASLGSVNSNAGGRLDLSALGKFIYGMTEKGKADRALMDQSNQEHLLQQQLGNQAQQQNIFQAQEQASAGAQDRRRAMIAGVDPVSAAVTQQGRQDEQFAFAQGQQADRVAHDQAALAETVKQHAADQAYRQQVLQSDQKQLQGREKLETMGLRFGRDAAFLSPEDKAAIEQQLQQYGVSIPKPPPAPGSEAFKRVDARIRGGTQAPAQSAPAQPPQVSAPSFNSGSNQNQTTRAEARALPVAPPIELSPELKALVTQEIQKRYSLPQGGVAPDLVEQIRRLYQQQLQQGGR